MSGKPKYAEYSYDKKRSHDCGSGTIVIELYSPIAYFDATLLDVEIFNLAFCIVLIKGLKYLVVHPYRLALDNEGKDPIVHTIVLDTIVVDSVKAESLLAKAEKWLKIQGYVKRLDTQITKPKSMSNEEKNQKGIDG